MARKSIEDVMNEIEDFLNSCSTKALSSNKLIVPRDEFDELFSDLKVKIPAEIDRCKKIMRNKEAILMDARKTADGVIADAQAQAQKLVSETEIMAQANQTAYETVEMARAQANDILAQATAQANEIRMGSMQYSNDMMMSIRNYVEATMRAEQANYENLMATLNNDYTIVSANIQEIQNQIVEYTGDPNSVTKAPTMRTANVEKDSNKTKGGMVRKMKQVVGTKDEKEAQVEEKKPSVEIPDFVATGEKVVPNETPLAAESNAEKRPDVKNEQAAVVENANKVIPDKVATPKDTANESVAKEGATQQKKIKKKIVKKRNPVIHTPQTAQETVAKTLEAAAANKVDKTVYKANGTQAREVPAVEGRVKRGPRVGRGAVEETTNESIDDIITVVDDQQLGTSMGVVDDFSMQGKF